MKIGKIGIVAPSSAVPTIELNLGVQHLETLGFEVVVHPTVLQSDTFYSASDENRAQAIMDYALDPTIDAIWCARGGYGATHLLPILEKKLKNKKLKKKILLGYSDATALLEFMRVRFSWRTIHAPMPALKTFSILPKEEWKSILDLLQPKPKGTAFQLNWLHQPHKKSILGPMVGGNFAVWNSLIGTRYAGSARGKILFFEEVSENIARIQRMVHHLDQSGGFKGVKALVLGDFTACHDTAPQVLKKLPVNLAQPTTDELQPLRRTLNDEDALNLVFSSLGQRLNIPVLKGLPLGHGHQHYAIGLGLSYTISPAGKLTPTKS
jgi:muramoyltetrapeptide carboxypeptidase